MRKKAKKPGFTMVELLVASVIAAFVAIVAVGSLRAFSASSERVEENIAVAGEVRFAANVISQDLLNFYKDTNRDNMKFTAMLEDTGGGEECVMTFWTVSRMPARMNQPESDVYEVEYLLMRNDEPDAGGTLVRRYWPNPDKDRDPGGVMTAIAEGIAFFELRFFDGTEWVSEWSEEMQSEPDLVEVNIAALSGEGTNLIRESFIVNLISASGNLSSTEEQAAGESENLSSEQQR
jgi:general secretion pathway protein J